jgi:hypothetical protein
MPDMGKRRAKAKLVAHLPKLTTLGDAMTLNNKLARFKSRSDLDLNATSVFVKSSIHKINAFLGVSAA